MLSRQSTLVSGRMICKMDRVRRLFQRDPNLLANIRKDKNQVTAPIAGKEVPDTRVNG